MSSIQNLLFAIQEKLLAIPAIRSVPPFPTEDTPPGPLVVTYPEGGEVRFGTPGERKDLTSVVVEVMTPRKDLPRDIEKMTGLHDDLMNALLGDPSFGGLIDTYGYLEWTFGPLAWGDTPTIGYRVIVREIKHRTAIPSIGENS